MEKDCVLSNQYNTQPERDHANRKRRCARTRKLGARNDTIDELDDITNQINEAAACAKELRAKKKELQSASGIKRTKAKPGVKVVATSQPPIAGPSQSVQVPLAEFSESEDLEANYHEAFDDSEVFFSNPSPARSLVLHCPTNPFAFESTPTRCLQSSTDF